MAISIIGFLCINFFIVFGVRKLPVKNNWNFKYQKAATIRTRVPEVRAKTLKPILDKSEIGDGENFTATCDFSRVISDPKSPLGIFELSIHRKYLDSPGSEFELIMFAGCNGFYPKPQKHISWPWKAVFHFLNVSKPEDQYIILHNTKSMCDDAGEYKCMVDFDIPGDGLLTHTETQLLRKKASCDQTTTESSPLPAQTANSGVHGTDSNPYSEPSTQISGFQVVKGSEKSVFIVETMLLIVVVVSVM